MSPLASDLMVTVAGLVPLVVLVVMCLRGERKLLNGRSPHPAE